MTLQGTPGEQENHLFKSSFFNGGNMLVSCQEGKKFDKLGVGGENVPSKN